MGPAGARRELVRRIADWMDAAECQFPPEKRSWRLARRLRAVLGLLPRRPNRRAGVFVFDENGRCFGGVRLVAGRLGGYIPRPVRSV